jgi:hypothetical protein
MSEGALWTVVSYCERCHLQFGTSDERYDHQESAHDALVFPEVREAGRQHEQRLREILRERGALTS